MRRILLVVATAAFLLGLGAPAALAAEPNGSDRSVVVAVAHDADVPAGDHVDTLIVVRGNAHVEGSVDALLVVDGTATLTGATAKSVAVVHGTAQLQAGTTVTGDVRTLNGTVQQAPGAVVQGTTRSFDADLAAFALFLIPMFILFFVGLGIAAIVAALVVAALGARQVREAERLISHEPGIVLVAGLVGSFVLPILAVLVTITVVGAPLGLAALLIVLPFLAFLGWIVAAIWVGDWLVERTRGSREAEHPYLAAFLGVIVLAVAGLIPFVSGIATLFGYGALLVMAWRTVRPKSPSVGAPSSQPYPTAS